MEALCKAAGLAMAEWERGLPQVAAGASEKRDCSGQVPEVLRVSEGLRQAGALAWALGPSEWLSTLFTVPGVHNWDMKAERG